jgi:hypothetical protein
MIEKSVLVKFMFHDSKWETYSYDFECSMSHIPRIGENVELPSSDPNSVTLNYNGNSCFSAKVDNVYWNVIKHNNGWPDVVISCYLVWV